VVKGQTGALFLLSEIGVAALSLGLQDMKSLIVEVIRGIERRTGCDLVTQLKSEKSTVAYTGIPSSGKLKNKFRLDMWITTNLCSSDPFLCLDCR
jgi:hypothetical protein